MIWPVLSRAQDQDAAAQEAPKKFYLPKNPTAAAYILGRLSNKDLVEAPRSEFVYVALLQRPGLERKYRVEALNGLAKERKTSVAEELVRALRELDGKGEKSAQVLSELGTIVTQTSPEELASQRAGFETLAGEAALALTRQIADAALVTAAGSADAIWAAKANDPAKLSDLIESIPLWRNPALRQAQFQKVKSLLDRKDAPELQKAATIALSSIPGHDVEIFHLLAGLVGSGVEAPTAIRSLQQIPRKSWPKEEAAALLNNVINYLKNVPVDQRTEPDAIAAVQFGNDLASLLPADQARTAGKELRNLGVAVFVIRTIPEQMLYDKTRLVLEAGKPVVIYLKNEDSMPHNIVVVQPGAVEEVGTAAEKMALEADAEGRLYIPNSSKILQATKLVEPGQQAKLAFTAPEEPGEYEYVCTFPGHWRRMTGKMVVVKDVDEYLATHNAPAEPKITEWKVEDFSGKLENLDAGRNLMAGKELFTKLACVQCHKLGAEGNSYGPELTTVFTRYQNNPAEVLRQILEPSLKIEDRYRTYNFDTKDGETVTGMVVKEEPDAVIVQSGPSEALIQTIKKSEIKAKQAQATSPMPLGLLATLDQEQILDLLAYVKSGGKAEPHQH